MRNVITLLCLLLLTASASARNPRGVAGPTGGPPLSTWYNVTPSNVNLTSDQINGVANYGTQTIGADTSNPGTLYAEFNAQGIWKSTDYGQTWVGPINTGTGGSTVTGCQGGMTVAPNATPGGVATIYQGCLGGPAVGLWYSTDGGVDWVNVNLVPPLPSGRPDVYQPQVDPYNNQILLMAGHEQNYLLESTNGGASWTNIPLATSGGGSGNGMQATGGTAFAYFINTGNATTTAQTWLWRSQLTADCYGTWRTTNGGASWTQVECLEHIHGSDQIYQVGNGTIFMAGYYGTAGNGVLVSQDYGQTWAQVGAQNLLTDVWGTSNYVYAIGGTASSQGATDPPDFELAPAPGLSSGTWSQVSTPSGMFEAGGQVAVVNDGTHNIFIGAMWSAGLWRYVEP